MTSSSEPLGSDDRRRFHRVREDCLVRFQKIDAESFFRPSGEGVTHNISAGGICFRTHESLAVGDPVALDLRIPEFGSSIIALGRVVRREAHGEVAVEFWWVGWADDDAQRAIADYIRKKLDDSSASPQL